MKKILSTMLVFVVSLSLAGVAIAASPKPPASFCINAGPGGIWALVTKAGTNMKMEDGTEKFYSVQGAYISSATMPLVGSGYMEGNVFHFVYNSTYNISGTPYFIQMEAFWDVVTKTGTMYGYYSATGNHSTSLSQVDCTDQVIVYMQGSGGPFPDGSPFVLPNQ